MHHIGTVTYNGNNYNFSVNVLPYGNQYAINGEVFSQQFLYYSDRYIFAELSGIDYWDEALDILCSCDTDNTCICGQRIVD